MRPPYTTLITHAKLSIMRKRATALLLTSRIFRSLMLLGLMMGGGFRLKPRPKTRPVTCLDTRMLSHQLCTD